MKYRKKPVVIEAMLLEKPLGEVLEWCGGRAVYDQSMEACVLIDTLEGRMQANIGDYIIKGIKGEFYPCKPDIFAETYEAVA